jgi:hypothetical protein
MVRFLLPLWQRRQVVGELLQSDWMSWAIVDKSGRPRTAAGTQLKMLTRSGG